MDYVETEGDTIDQAIENALVRLGVERDRISIEILSEGKRGILGFGTQKARVRASLRRSAVKANPLERVPNPMVIESAAPKHLTEAETAAVGEKAKGVLSEILKRMGIEAAVQAKSGDKVDEIVLEVICDDSGLLIGRKGQTLEALQYLVTRIAGDRQGSEGPHILVDIENYRQRRKKSLEDMALRLGEKAKRQRKTVTVDALSAADRRIVHAALQDDPWITTKSLGQGSYRRLLIIPEGDRKRKEESKPVDKQDSRSQSNVDRPGPARTS
ncbi:MAG TPA: RNA-binding cell elongation regulator Jag/EloR [Candidatus Polarisedimenticolaceae bacterium]|nr:RNA-binding cell elongation regulator Jag/EloR [Candidatus Polarisedimenticolaceae bacterium]